MPEATITSFILRFTQERTLDSENSSDAWYGTIRHIQSNKEIRFARIENALAFIARYVDIDANDEVDGKQS